MPLEFGSIAAIVTGLVEGANLLSSRFSSKEPATAPMTTDRMTEIEERLAAIEAHETDQDRLVERLAEQLENLAAASEHLNRRVSLLLGLSAGALLLSLGALLVALLRG